MNRILLGFFLFITSIAYGQPGKTNGHFNKLWSNKIIATEVNASKVTGIDSTEIDNTNGLGDSLVLFTPKGLKFKKLRFGNNVHFDYEGDSVIIIGSANLASFNTFSARAGETQVVTDGFTAVTAGTATARVLSSANTLGSTSRLGLVSAATAGSMVYFTSANNFLWRGNTAGKGGFMTYLKFGIPSTTSNAMAFFGLIPTTVAAVGNPSALFNMIGIAKDVDDVNFKFMTNDDAGVATEVNTNIPISTNDLYEVFINADPGASFATITLRDVSVGLSSTWTFSTNLPVNTVFLKPELFLTNNTTAAVIAIDIAKFYAETNY